MVSGMRTLHSNMVLLIQQRDPVQRVPWGGFTFQYGSINTMSQLPTFSNLRSLHSNMVLLIHIRNCQAPCKVLIFTFQYGSINTKGSEAHGFEPYVFTFQYGSINTGERPEEDAGTFILYIPIWFY